MKLIKIKNRIRCELGVCKNKAEYALILERTGIRSRIYLCSDCVKKIYEAATEVLKQKKSEENKALKSPEKAEVKDGRAK